ncbi:MAG: ATP-binding protein, partial [Oscillospiraceae bacterium]|nr:ATP-binding protein [Oscillospiraceae bacterium]
MSDQMILICEKCGKIRCVPANDAEASPCDCGETKKFHTPTNSKVKKAIIEIIPKITAVSVTAAVGFFAPGLIPWAYPFTLKALEVTTDHAIEKCGEWMQNRLYEEDNYQKQISSLFEKELKKLMKLGDPHLKAKKRGSGYAKYQHFRQYYHFCQENSVSIYFLLRENNKHPDIFHEDTIRYIFENLFKVESTTDSTARNDILTCALELRRNFRNAILSDHKLSQIWLLLDMQNRLDTQMKLLSEKLTDIQNQPHHHPADTDTFTGFVRNAHLPVTLNAENNRFSYYNPKIGFHGRKTELTQLHAFLLDARPVVVWTITGQGGCGKSRLALQFAKECRSEMGVVWLDNTTLNQWKHIRNFEVDDSIPNRMVLFVCDYASEKLPELDGLIGQLRQMDGKFRILLLERAQNWQNTLRQSSQYRQAGDCLYQDESLHLSDFQLDEEACRRIIADFAAAYYDRTLTDAEADAIIEQTQNLTVNGTKRQKEIRCLFMLLMTDAYCNSDSGAMNHWDADALVKEYIKRTKIMALKKYSEDIVHHAYRLLALATAAGGLDLEDANHPQLISEQIETLNDLLNWDRSELEQLLSMITDSASGGSVIKPLYPDIVGEYLFCSEYLNYNHPKAIAAWHEHLSKCEYTDIFLARTTADWIESGLKVIDKLEHSAPELFDTMKILADAMQEINSHADAQRVKEHMRSTLSVEDIHGMTAYAAALERMLELSKAEQREQVFAEMQELYPLTLPVLSDEQAPPLLNRLGGICQAMGKYTLAMRYLQEALEIAEGSDTVNELETARLCNNIALIYMDMGKLEQALEYSLKTLAVTEKLLGTEHPSTATTYNNIATIYWNTGKLEQALEYSLKALAVTEKILGTEHPDTATTYNNIAMIYMNMGKLEQALEYSLKALAVAENVLGTEHPNTATIYNNIAMIYQDMGKLEQALEYSLKALAVRERLLGTEHPSTAASYNNITTTYYSMGDYKQALEYS